MLVLRRRGECCDRGLPPASADLPIDGVDCALYVVRAEESPYGCASCGGELARPPVRPVAAGFPPSAKRVLKLHEGAAAA